LTLLAPLASLALMGTGVLAFRVVRRG
jgi:hypothetical protein